MAVVIFGANGFIGRNLIHELSEHKEHIVALSRSFDEGFFNNYPDVQCCPIDFRNIDSYADYVNEGDTVVHLIYMGIPYKANSDKKFDIKNNLIPSVELVELCADKAIKRFIFSSSGGAVYGNLSKEVISEEQHCYPVNSYGVTKLATEKYIQAIAGEHNMDYAVLRISNPYGGHPNPKSPVGIFNKIEQSLLNDTFFELRVPLTTVRDYIPVEDVARSLVRVIYHQKPIFDTFNVSSGKGMSIAEVIEIMENKHGKKLNIKVVPGENPEVISNILDASKFERCFQKISSADISM